jgi:hypothetical protein
MLNKLYKAVEETNSITFLIAFFVLMVKDNVRNRVLVMKTFLNKRNYIFDQEFANII